MRLIMGAVNPKSTSKHDEVIMFDALTSEPLGVVSREFYEESRQIAEAVLTATEVIVSERVIEMEEKVLRIRQFAHHN